MRVKFWLLSALLAIAGGSVVAAQNTAQPLQPHGNRVVASLGGGAAPLMPATFSVEFYNGTIVPSIGTAGTHTRASTIDYMDTANTVVQAASGVPALGAAPFDPDAPAGPTGLFGAGDVRNYFLWNEALDNVAWVKNGAAAVTANSTTAPDGNATADTLTGSGAGDAIQQASAIAATTNAGKFLIAVWLKVSTGTHTVTLKLRGDSGITPEETTKNVTVTTAWKPFYMDVDMTAAATGNLEGEIEFNDTTGKVLYAWRPQMILAGGTAGTRWGNICPWTKTEAATATTLDTRLRYAGAEIQAAATPGMTYAIWVYHWADDTFNKPNYWMLSHPSVDDEVEIWVSGSSLLGTWAHINKSFGEYLPDQQWSHLEITLNYPGNEMRQYINGVKKATHAITMTAQSAFSYLQIGAFSTNWEAAQVVGAVQVYYGLDSDDDALARFEEQKGNFGY